MRAQIRRLSRRALRLEACEDRMMMAGTPKLIAIIPSEGSVIQEGTVLNVGPSQLIFRFDDGQVINGTSLGPNNVSMRGAGGDGVLGNADDVSVRIGFVGVGDNPNEVVVRFANPLPDDFYQISVSQITTTMGGVFSTAAPVRFRVDLGAQVVAVVPQPITRNAQGRLVQALDTIEVFFNSDKLNPTSAQNTAFYQLIRTQDTATNVDDGAAVNPLTAVYEAAANKVTLKFRSTDLLGYGQTFRLRIGNNDPVPLAPPPALAIDDVEVIEGDAGTSNALFTVRLSKPSDRAVTVGYASDNPIAGVAATPGADYSAVAGVLTFAPGVTTQTIAVPVVGDLTNEHAVSAAEKFVIRLSNATNAIITRSSATGSILDDDGTPYVTIGDVMKLEGDGKTTPFVFTVRLLGAVSQPVSVRYRTIDGSAASSVDFAAVSGNLNFALGQRERTITVNVSGDTNLADDKQFYLVLSDPTNAQILGGTAIGTILNDDGGPVDPGRIMSDPGDTFARSFDLGTVSAASQGIQSASITSSIDPQPYALQYPGDLLEPGKRRLPELSTVQIDNLNELGGDPSLPRQNNVLGFTLQSFGNIITRLRGPDPAGGVPTIPFNFQDVYGALPTGAVLHNLITPNEKDQARQAFALLTQHLGVQFVESPNLGLTIATGDLRAINRLIVSGPGDATYFTGDVTNPSTGIAQPTAVLDSGELWDDRGPESTRPGYQPYFRTVIAAILQMLGVGEGGSLPGAAASATGVAGSSALSTGIAPEQVYPGDADLVSGQHLYRPDSNDVDIYQFSLDKSGTVELETIAQRLAAASQLNSVISVYDGNRQLIARNDDYFSRDSFLRLELQAGQYFVAVSSTGNTAFDPIVSGSGQGGTTQGLYQLHVNFTPRISPGIIDATNTALDGDGDGRPGGAYSFWFKAKDNASTSAVTNTIFVDKVAPLGGVGASGSLDNPYRDIATALGKASPGQIVRIVGNAGVDGKLETGLDAVPYQIGTDIFGNVLPDGRGVETPAGVTIMIDAGAVIKLSGANFDIGSSAQGVGRAGAALQVLGTPTQNVYFTSLNDKTLGFVNPTQVLATLSRGDWGGLVFRADSDLEQQGIFLNYVHGADLSYGGGAVIVNGVPSVFNPIHLESARPSIAYNTITNSADAAMSADPNSFEETEFQDLTYTADYKRVGPDLHHNLLVKTVKAAPPATQPVEVSNSINALFVRVRTNAGQNLDPLTVSARVDERDISIYLSENLVIQGQSVGYEMVADPRDPRPDRPTRYVTRPRLSARLALDAGVVMKINAARIEARQGGQLIAEGGEFNPVVFTSAADDSYGSGGTFDTAGDGANSSPAPGNWAGIYVGASSTANLDRTVVSYAGGQSSVEGGFDNFNPIEIHQARARIANSILKHNAAGQSSTDRVGRGANSAAAIFVRGAQPVIVHNTIQDNAGAAISVDVNSLNHQLVVDSGRTSGLITITDRSVGNHGALVRGNRLSNDATNGMVVRGGIVTTESVWDDTDIVHVVLDEVLVPDFNTYTSLRLESNSSESLVVKFSGASAGLTAAGRPLETNDRIGGSVQVIGVPGHAVVLTSLADDTAGAGFDPLGRSQVDTNNNAGSTTSAAPQPGDWRSVLLRPYSNDRNVEVTTEFERTFSSSGDTNGVVASAQSLGTLAPNEKSGDDTARLGFEIHGTISQAFDSNASPPKLGDVDVYSFKAKPGTEVWFDIDSTSPGLDTILELIDANNAVVARSNDSAAESAQFATRDNLIFGNALNPIPGGIGLPGAGIARTMERGLYSQPDRFTTNIHDAGMRLVLPGDPNAAAPVTYYVRVRAAAGDVSNLTGGASVGGYQLQVRLGEVDEVPGSTVRYSDIRYATNGIEIQGKPGHSPLAGEASETTTDNSIFDNAQFLGNLLKTDRGNLTVAGNLDNIDDIDWYSFDLSYDLYRVVKGLNDVGRSWATMFDIDYADGASRPELTLSVFDSNGRLLLIGRDSNVVDDQAGQGTGNLDPARGSFGGGDPLINMQLPEGPQVNGDPTSPDFGRPLATPQRYYVAITSSRVAPQVLGAYYKSRGLIDPVDSDNSLVRLQPVDSIARVAEDRIAISSDLTAGTGGATPPRLNLTPKEFVLGDVTLYGITSNDLYTINPFTGTVLADVTGNARLASNNRYNDMVLRNDGRIFAEYSDIDPDDRVFRDFRELSPENGGLISAGGDAPEGQFLLPDGSIGTPGNGVTFPIHFEALSYVGKNGTGRALFSVGEVPSHPVLDPDHFFRNALYRLDPDTGAVVADNVDDPLIGSELAPRATLNTDDISRRITTSAGSALTLRDGDTLSISAGGANILFEIDLGVTLRIDPATRGSDIAAGAQFSVTDHNGQVSARFRIIKSAQPAISGVTDILIADTARAQDIATAITNAIRSLGRFQELTPRILPNNVDISFVDSTATVADHVVDLGTLPTNRFAVNTAGISDPTRAVVAINPFMTAAQVAQTLATTIRNTALIQSIGAYATGADVVLSAPTGQTIDVNLRTTDPEFRLTNPTTTIGGRITGIAMTADATIYAVTDTGQFLVYNIPRLLDANGPIGVDFANRWLVPFDPLTAVKITDESGQAPTFSGLTQGPPNAAGGQYSDTFFATTTDGRIFALDSSGVLQPIFADGSASIDTGLTTLSGIGFSTLDFNLWHRTVHRGGPQPEHRGHGVETSWFRNHEHDEFGDLDQDAQGNRSQVRVLGGTSYWFGLEHPDDGDSLDPQPGIGNFRTNDGVYRTYDQPGGSYGSLVSNTFNLEAYSPLDKPTLYFNYFLDTQNATSSVIPPGMLDAVRVYVSDDGVSWSQLATNNSRITNSVIKDRQELPDHPSTSGGLYRGDNLEFSNQQVQELFDNTGGWRQARVDLGDFAGVKRNELTVVGGGAAFRDGDTFTLTDAVGNQSTFEFDSDNALADTSHFRIAFSRNATRDAMLTTVVNAINLAADQNLVRVDAQRTTGIPTSTPLNRITILNGGVAALPGQPTIVENSNGLAIRSNSTLRLRFDFDTAASLNVGDLLSAGPTTGEVMTALPAADLRDGDIFIIGSHTFEFDKGFTINVKAGANALIADGDTFRVAGVSGEAVFEFDRDGAVAPGNVAVSIADADSPEEIAAKIAAAIVADGTTGVVPLRNANRVDLGVEGLSKAQNLVVSSAGLTLEGDAPGTLSITGATPVMIDGSMSADSVAIAVAAGLDRFFANLPGRSDNLTDFTTAKLDGPLIRIIGETINDGGPLPFNNYLTGKSTPASPDFYDGNFSGGRGDNRHEGVYIDDVIIGFAEHGEIVTGIPTGARNTDFIRLPDGQSSSTRENVVTSGPYQLQIRSGQQYSRVLPNGSVVPVRRFDTNDRATSGISLDGVVGSTIYEGQQFTISDGANSATFEFTTDQQLSDDRNLAIFYAADDAPDVIAVKIRAAINAQQRIKVLAGPESTANAVLATQRVELSGAVNVTPGGREQFVGQPGATIANESLGSNDTITTAVNSGLDPLNPGNFVDVGAIGDNPNLLGNRKGLDVDMISLEAKAGDHIHVSIKNLSNLNAGLSLFGPDMNRLNFFTGLPTLSTEPLAENFSLGLYNADTAAEPTLDYIVPMRGDGTYYIAVAEAYNNGLKPLIVPDPIFGNTVIEQNAYDIAVEGSGRLSKTPVGLGRYEVTVSLNAGAVIHEAGDDNTRRDQGYTVISSNQISHVSQFGIAMSSGQTPDSPAQPQPGPAQNLRVLNPERLVPGVSISNNLLHNNGQGGIRLDGDVIDDPNNPNTLSAAPVVRIVNNTIYGAATAAGVGVQIGLNAGPTLLNNIFANLETAISVDPASTSTVVIGYNLYQNNTAKFNRPLAETQPIDLAATDPLFINAATGNFYLAAGSRAIDSALDSLQDRATLQTVTGSIGIPPSPILSPNSDLLGQLRVDDPSVGSAPGLGSAVFKDRGAIDRADFAGPLAVLATPADNDSADQDPAFNVVSVAGAPLSEFLIRFVDANGIGIDDTLAADLTNYTLRRRIGTTTTVLANGVDFVFTYDATNNIAKFAAASGVYAEGSYTIELKNGPPAGPPAPGAKFLRDVAGNALRPNAGDGTTQFAINIAAIATSGWQNSTNNLDVNGDGRVTPLDVLTIVNRLNTVGPGRLPTPASPPPYYDVNGDGSATPLDALAIINFLNQRAGGALANSLFVTPLGLIDAAPAPNGNVATSEIALAIAAAQSAAVGSSASGAGTFAAGMFADMAMLDDAEGPESAPPFAADEPWDRLLDDLAAGAIASGDETSLTELSAMEELLSDPMKEAL